MRKKLTIEEILWKVDMTSIGSIELDYDGDVETYEDEWDIPAEIRDEEASYRVVKKTNSLDVLKIIVR